MSDKTYAHFIGIGGAGMSGIALVLAQRGVAVSGSDLKESRYSRALQAAGVRVSIGHDAGNVGDPDVVVVSTAIPRRNPELAAALERGIEVWPRAKMLAHLAGGRDTIAVAGTHGKTSTSSMVATMLSGMDLDPSFLIGGEVDGFKTNARNGSGSHYVVEADESDGSFVHLSPKIAVITNIEADHLDHYSGIDEIESTFCDFMDRMVDDGTLVVCADDRRLVDLARGSGRRVVTYGFSADSDVRCELDSREGIGHRFTVRASGVTPVSCLAAVPGVHMVSNATASLAVAFALGLDMAGAADALSRFTGVRRRFDLIDEVDGITIVDDYAHHPTEVAATVGAAAELGFQRTWVLFQPHRYSRTAAFAKEFSQAFGSADRVVFMDVYSAGEAPVPGVSGRTLLNGVLESHPRSQVSYLPHRADIVPYLSANLSAGDLVLTMGAGDVTTIGPQLADALRERENR